MHEAIIENVARANTLEEVKSGVIHVFEEARKNGAMRIGYVSGIISSDGPEFVERNVRILQQYTENVRGMHGFPIFAPTEVFTEEVFKRINAHEIPVQDWLDFWKDILEAGYITDIFMTPRWEKSVGATDEYNNATRLKLLVHYVR